MRALVLHSGGLDSTVCLLLARQSDREVVSLGIDYGQRHHIELDYAQAQCRTWNIERRLIRVNWDKPARPIPTDRPLAAIRATPSPAFLPGRNLVFLALACAEAAGLQAGEVWLGVNAVDFSGYPDCTPDFIQAFRSTVTLAFRGGPQIHTPLIAMTKPEIAATALQLGLHSGDTWSCYQPRLTPTGVSPCHKCDACVLHDHAWQHLSAPPRIE